MNLKKAKDKLVNNIKQEGFRKELEDQRYACYTDEQKKDIMRLIKKTRWGLPHIRKIFQNEKIQQNIDKLIYIFEVMEKRSDHKLLLQFCWNIVCKINDSLDSNVDFDLGVAMVEAFANSVVSKEKYYRATELMEKLIINDEELPLESKIDLFKSVINSTENGLVEGNNLYYIYCIYREGFDSFKYFKLLNKVYSGVFDNRPDICEMIEEIHSETRKIDWQLAMFSGNAKDYWEIDENVEAFNRAKDVINYINREAIKIEDEGITSPEGPTGPKM